MTSQSGTSSAGKDSEPPGRKGRAWLVDEPGLVLLRDAWDCAHDNELDPWQFAVEIDALRAAGLTNTDLRWLINRGLLEHRCEQTRPGDRSRRFGKASPGSLVLAKRDCCILTEAGYQFASAPPAGRGGDEPTDPASPVAPPDRVGLPEPDSHVPSWDARLHELRLGHRLVKRFSRPAPAQEAILSAFEEEDWPPAIDDPLPAQYNQDPKRRLHYTIRNLNRGQKPLCIRFFINGNGETIRWELVSVRRSDKNRSARRKR
jgi:hypothetical protein